MHKHTKFTGPDQTPAKNMITAHAFLPAFTNRNRCRCGHHADLHRYQSNSLDFYLNTHTVLLYVGEGGFIVQHPNRHIHAFITLKTI